MTKWIRRGITKCTTDREFCKILEDAPFIDTKIQISTGKLFLHNLFNPKLIKNREYYGLRQIQKFELRSVPIIVLNLPKKHLREFISSRLTSKWHDLPNQNRGDYNV